MVHKKAWRGPSLACLEFICVVVDVKEPKIVDFRRIYGIPIKMGQPSI
jgi:hypothetical protein